MKRLIMAGWLVGLILGGLCLATSLSPAGTAWTCLDEDPNDEGGTAGPEWTLGVIPHPVMLADDEGEGEGETDPNDPNEPAESGSE